MSYRTALVTGASSRIGAALAKRLAAKGTEVALVARRVELMEILAADIRRSGGSARIYPADLQDPVATEALIRRVDDELGGLDLVIANAGVAQPAGAARIDWKKIEPTIQLNVSAAAATLTAVLPRMVERRRGHLVGLSSLAAYRGMPRNAAYAASKAFLTIFLESLRIDLRGTGVSVTDIRAGFIRTAITEKNKFHMPFLLDLDEAADKALSAIERRKAILAFPWQLATMSRFSRFVPTSLYDRVMGGVSGLSP